MTQIPIPVARLVDAYRASVAARDIEAFMRLYDPAVRIFDAWGVWSYEDAAAWRVAVEGWFATHPGGPVRPSTSTTCRWCRRRPSPRSARSSPMPSRRRRAHR